MRIANRIIGTLILLGIYGQATIGSEPVVASGRDVALCVGINDYVGTMRKLKYCVNDAYAIKQRLDESGNFRKVTVLSDLDEDGKPRSMNFVPSENIIMERLKQLAGAADPNGKFLFFFSGHGVERDGVSCIVPVDGNESLAIPLSSIRDAMAKSRAKHKLMIIDACHSGGDTKGMAGIRKTLEDQDVGVVVSCGADEFSVEIDNSGRSLFTLILEDALTGKADYDDDGEITGVELFRYLDNGMSDYILDNDLFASQTPELNEAAKEIPFLRVDKELMARVGAERLAKEQELAEQEKSGEPAKAEIADQAKRQDGDLERSGGETAATEAKGGSGEVAAIVKTSEPEYYTDPATGRVFVYDETKKDWVVYTEPARTAQINQPRYQQPYPQQHQQQYQRNYYSEPRKGMDAGTALSVFSTIASMLSSF